jgi:hypothetical protein
MEGGIAELGANTLTQLCILIYLFSDYYSSFAAPLLFLKH